MPFGESGPSRERPRPSIRVRPMVFAVVATLAVAASWWPEAPAQEATTAPAAAELAARSQARALDLPSELPVVVSAAFDLTGLHAIDDRRETFEFSGVLTLVWRDERQAFDAAAEGLRERLYHGNYQFNEISPSWYPQVVVANAVEFTASQGILLRVEPDGTSTLIQPFRAVARSPLEQSRYPFDAQQLEARMRVLGFHSDEVMLHVNESAVALSGQGDRLPQWEIESIRAQGHKTRVTAGGRDVSAMTVTLDVRRRPFFMLRLVILPLTLIVGLSWTVFWMDRSSLGDRMSVSFVGILTAVSYQVLVSANMPRIAHPTFIHAFLSFSFLIMVATVLVNLRVGALDKIGDFERGDRLDRRCRWGFPLAFLGLIAVAAAYSFL